MSPMSPTMSAAQIFILAVVVLAAMGVWLAAVFVADRTPRRRSPAAGEAADRPTQEDQKQDQKEDQKELSGARR